MNTKIFNKSSEERREMILSENVMKTIFLLTIPVFMMGIVQSLIPISDGLFLNNKAGYVISWGYWVFTISYKYFKCFFSRTQCCSFCNNRTTIWKRRY